MLLRCLRRHLAALNWQLATVRALLAAGADVAARSCYQGTPLYLAAQGQTDPEFQRPGASDQQVAVLQALIAAGSEVDARDQGGLAPLHAAARTGHAGAVTALLRAGADVEALSDPAAPPALHRPALYWAAAALHWAAARGHVECVRALLAGGANPAATAGAGLTAADHVRQAGSITPQGTTMLQLLAEAELRRRCAACRTRVLGWAGRGRWVLGLHCSPRICGAGTCAPAAPTCAAGPPPARRQARRACAVCGQAARSTCSRCRAVRYCSAGCQRRHWQVRLFEGWELWSMLLRSLPAASDRPLLLPGPQMHKRMCKAPGT